MSEQQKTPPSSTPTPSIPDVQLRLQENLDRDFNGRLFPLEPHRWVEFGLTYRFQRETQREVFQRLRDDKKYLFSMLIDVTCVDWLDTKDARFEVVYQLLSISHLHRLTLKVEVGESSPEVESVRNLWPTANFLEREVWDMYGVSFKGHGDLRRILMYDEFTGHPLRKDYPLRGKQPRVQLRIPELRNTSADMLRDQLVALPVRQGIRNKDERRPTGTPGGRN